MKYYHYTTSSAADRIKQSRKIKMSSVQQRDAVYGDGVYLTDLAPDTPDEELEQLWGGDSKVNMAIAIELNMGLNDSWFVKQCRPHVYLYAYDVDLDRITHEFHDRSQYQRGACAVQ
mmetsp:Transcript_78933/g.150162  ORF Transcript_78933/g.150162 Transcript_78933/m.150162 type:complete len:117 (-) Transcript_78933:92-442(-)